jgi:hypothetical protein
VIRIEWLGAPLDELGLRFVRVVVEARGEGGEVLAGSTIEWRAGLATEPQSVTVPRGSRVTARVERRFTDGTQERGESEAVIGDVLPITP